MILPGTARHQQHQFDGQKETALNLRPRLRKCCLQSILPKILCCEWRKTSVNSVNLSVGSHADQAELGAAISQLKRQGGTRAYLVSDRQHGSGIRNSGAGGLAVEGEHEVQVGGGSQAAPA